MEPPPPPNPTAMSAQSPQRNSNSHEHNSLDYRNSENNYRYTFDPYNMYVAYITLKL